MKTKLIVGILRETRKQEYRAPLTPADVSWLTKRGLEVEVESNPIRVFTDKEYRSSGAKIVNRIKNADILLGIKEVRPSNLYRDKIYMFFSHTSKGQINNMPLLKECLERKVTLIDYEKIVDSQNKRLVHFGRFAGVCGALDSLHYLGKKLEWKGIKNPFSLVKPACKYRSLKEAKQDLKKVSLRIQEQGLPEKLSPFIIGIVGQGNASKGAQEIIDLLNPVELRAKNLIACRKGKKNNSGNLYKIVFLRKERLRFKNNYNHKLFQPKEYLKNPEKFESNLDKGLSCLNLLVHASYWDSRYPRLVTKAMVDKRAKMKNFHLEFIADISCDLNGSIELTRKTGSTNKPTFTYSFGQRFVEGYKSKGVTVLAIDNLPSQLPKDASESFSRLIRNYVYQLALAGTKVTADNPLLPLEIRQATLTQQGKLTKKFSYLSNHLEMMAPGRALQRDLVYAG
jgi:alpha-aminoadipic semialdehyde synthase